MKHFEMRSKLQNNWVSNEDGNPADKSILPKVTDSSGSEA